MEGNTATSCVFTVSNTGFTNHLIVSSITLDDTLDFGVFFTDCQQPGGVPAQSACSINVAFTPQSIGPYSTQLHISDNASSSPQTVTVTGTGILPPNTTDSLVPSTLAFGGSPVGQPNEQFITVNNTGFTNPLVLQTLTLTDTTAGYTGTNEFSIVPGDSSCPAPPAGNWAGRHLRDRDRPDGRCVERGQFDHRDAGDHEQHGCEPADGESDRVRGVGDHAGRGLLHRLGRQLRRHAVQSGLLGPAVPDRLGHLHHRRGPELQLPVAGAAHAASEKKNPETPDGFRPSRSAENGAGAPFSDDSG